MPDDQNSSNLKNAELRLQGEQQKLEAIFYGSETPLVVFQGPDMVVEMFNDKYQEIYQGRELLGKPLFKAVPELQDTPFPGILKNVYETGKHFISHEGFAKIYNKVSGKLEDRYFDTTFSRISYGNDKNFRILATPREVTERVLTRKKLEESLKELKHERDLRERFVSALTHDLRTPLAISKLCAEILKGESETPETVVDMAGRISISIDRADRMIRDLLDANAIRAGAGIPVALEECRLDLITSDVISDLKELHGARFEIKNNKGEISGHWDCMAIHRLLENLIINAIKYGTPDSKITITLNAENSFVEIAIHNEGTPISLEDQKYLFDQYSRSQSAVESGQIGWGIGLAIVKGLVEAHKGIVRVESSIEAGTTFFIKLPMNLAEI